jgi:hypothetical protein
MEPRMETQNDRVDESIMAGLVSGDFVRRDDWIPACAGMTVWMFSFGVALA